MESGYDVTAQEVASQTTDKGGLRRALSDESMDTGFISDCSQVNPSHRFCSFPWLTLRWHEPRTLKSARLIDTNPPDLCAHCQEANCTCPRSTSTAPRRRRTGEPPDRGRAEQDPLPALPEPPLDVYLLESEQAHIVLFWYKEAIRARAEAEAVANRCKFTEEQYEKALAKVAALRQSTEVEPTQPGPRGKRAETIKETVSGKGKGKACADTRKMGSRRTRMGREGLGDD